MMHPGHPAAKSCCLLNKRLGQPARQMCIVFLAECTISRKSDCFPSSPAADGVQRSGRTCRQLLDMFAEGCLLKRNYFSPLEWSGANFKMESLMAPSVQLLPFSRPAFLSRATPSNWLANSRRGPHTRRIRNVPAQNRYYVPPPVDLHSTFAG